LHAVYLLVAVLGEVKYSDKVTILISWQVLCLR